MTTTAPPSRPTATPTPRARTTRTPTPRTPTSRAEPLLRRLVGRILRERRNAVGRTLRDVAADARVSLAYLSEIERGRKEASSEVLVAVCGALGMTLADLLAAAHESLTAPRPRPLTSVPTEPRMSTPAEHLTSVPTEMSLRAASARADAAGSDISARGLGGPTATATRGPRVMAWAA